VSDELILAIDQGTTGTTVLVLDGRQTVVGRAYREIPQIYPRPGEVEHDPEAIWRSVVEAIEEAVAKVAVQRVAAIGITNQRETTLVWDRATDRPLANAIVWQDRRTSPACAELIKGGYEAFVRARTGLVLDPYFSATKIRWLLENVSGLLDRTNRGQVAFGTVDTFLLWRLTGSQSHKTDVTNAARTLLFDITSMRFDEELCKLFRVPPALLPEVAPTVSDFGRTKGLGVLPDGIPIVAMAGDQQAALFGQDCTVAGDAKCTFGTGAFLLMNVGNRVAQSERGLLATVAWTLDGKTSYALEGSAFVAGALVQWLRDGLGIITKTSEVETLARQAPDSGGLLIVPALSGLGAPHWRPDARGLITGITRGTTKAHIARAALEAIALQNVELLEAMQADAGRPINSLRVDGGAAANSLLIQIQADLLGVQIFRPDMVESTALGAAKLAALGIGMVLGDGTTRTARLQIFQPNMSRENQERCAGLRERWRKAVAQA
jgi:glycerol kinase